MTVSVNHFSIDLIDNFGHNSNKMSILAEPKRKVNWSLNPRGKYWSEDKSKLGQKLLESMGWREGLGLGKNNNGITDNIRVGVNLDNKGLGYKPNADKVWVDKNQDFEQLLANLAVHHNNSCNTKAVKVSNLEEESKKLRNRLHYNKLIKAKNLSQCSEKDLISIFPKKLDYSDESQSFEQNSGIDSAKDLETNGNTFESKTNLNDYFKSKMDKMKLKLQLNKIDLKLEDIDNNIESQMNNKTINDLIEDESSRSSSTSSLKSKKQTNLESIESSDNSTLDSKNESIIKIKKQKKSKKNKRKEQSFETIGNSFDNSLDINLEQQSNYQKVVKKDKIKKNKKPIENSSKPAVIDTVEEEVPVNQMNDSSDTTVYMDSDQPTNHKKVNKKDKKKRKKTIEELTAEEDVETKCESLKSDETNKKSKKRKKLNPEECQTLVPKGYDSNSMSVSNSLKNYQKIRDAIQSDTVLRTTNMITLKGYGSGL